jgi:hypothetical protein
MLIPNKFNGYQADGCRLLPVMGGVGEAALLGAAMGGGSAALTGGDPLKGALLGGLTGGIGGGISSLLPAAGAAGTTIATAAPAAATAAVPAATAALPAATLPAATTALPAATTGTAAIGATPGIAGSGIAGLEAANIAANPGLFPAGSTAPGSAVAFSPVGQATTIPTTMPDITAGVTPAVGGVEPTAADVINRALASGNPPTTGGTFMEGMQRFIDDPIASMKRNPLTSISSAIRGATGARKELETPGEYDGPLKRFRYSPDAYRPQFAEGGITSLTSMPVERMSDRNDAMAMMANRNQMYAAGGGISSLGSYSDGGRMLKGPGDGMSDSIPASISNKRPARLADGEFVVPADVVSHLGNGSTDAGARQLYSMMDKVRNARTGTKKQGREINPRKMMPA